MMDQRNENESNPGTNPAKKIRRKFTHFFVSCAVLDQLFDGLAYQRVMKNKL